MKGCWIEPIQPADDLSMKYHSLSMKYQYVSDLFIALAYFSIPVELIYFVNKKAVFPYRWVLVQFGAFIILCGATHFISLWSSGIHSRTLAAVMAVSKMCTALVSCATAFMLVYVIPDLFSMKTRESDLKNKAEELDREMGISISEEKIGRHVRMLTHEIRSTLDRHTILNTTFFELARTLVLEECTLWMPTCSGLELRLSHSFRQGQLHTTPATVPICLPLVMDVFGSEGPLVISSDSPVVMIRPHRGRYVRGEAAAVRVPLLNLLDFHINDGSEPSMRSYALMVLTLPYDGVRRWHDYELKLVNAVADQVAVALSHAAILEESMRAQELLMEQNLELVVACQDAETATHSWNDFIAMTNHEMQTIMHDIIDLSSRLEETQLTFEHQRMVNTIQRNSYLLHTQINDVLELSRLEDGSLNLDMRIFNLSALFRENIKFIKPIASGKKLSFSMSLSSDLPEYAVGDDKRLFQATMILVNNAVKFTREGNIHVTLCLERPEYMRDPITPEFSPVYDNHHFHMRVQVRGTEENFDPQYNLNFTNSVQLDLGLAICRRLVNIMGGHLWIESERFGKGSTVIFVVNLGFPGQANEQLFHLPSTETGDKGI